MNKPVIGFIGLGLMGGNMAECLQNNGFDLVVMGRNKDAVGAAVARGAVDKQHIARHLSPARKSWVARTTTQYRCSCRR